MEADVNVTSFFCYFFFPFFLFLSFLLFFSFFSALRKEKRPPFILVDRRNRSPIDSLKFQLSLGHQPLLRRDSDLETQSPDIFLIPASRVQEVVAWEFHLKCEQPV